MNLKNYLKIALFIMLIFCTIDICNASQQQIAPDFKLQDMNNISITLSSYRDKQTVLLFFWTTWCHFCRKELKLLDNRYPQLLKDGIELLAINVRESFSVVEKFIKSYTLDFRVILDKDADVAYDYNILGVPTYILIDKKGYIFSESNYFPQEEYQKLISQIE